MQLVREMAQVRGELCALPLEIRQGLPGLVGGLGNLSPNTAQANRERSDPLADVVMEIAGDPGAFIFPRGYQAPRKVTHFIVTSSRLFLAEPQCRLRPASSAPLHEQGAGDRP